MIKSKIIAVGNEKYEENFFFFFFKQGFGFDYLKIDIEDRYKMQQYGFNSSFDWRIYYKSSSQKIDCCTRKHKEAFFSCLNIYFVPAKFPLIFICFYRVF